MPRRPALIGPRQEDRPKAAMQTFADIEAPAPLAQAPVPISKRASWLSALLDSELAQLAGWWRLYSLLAVLFIRVFYISDPDIWWHLRTGDWILAHHTVPSTDPFSSYGMGKALDRL